MQLQYQQKWVEFLPEKEDRRIKWANSSFTAVDSPYLEASKTSEQEIRWNNSKLSSRGHKACWFDFCRRANYHSSYWQVEILGNWAIYYIDNQSCTGCILVIGSWPFIQFIRTFCFIGSQRVEGRLNTPILAWELGIAGFGSCR